jgi:hypothetical protein
VVLPDLAAKLSMPTISLLQGVAKVLAIHAKTRDGSKYLSSGEIRPSRSGGTGKPDGEVARAGAG